MRITVLIALLFAHSLVQAGTLTGRVVRVTDGNTLVVADANYAQHRIRLLGIAAPAREQAYGAKSRERLFIAVAGKFVVVEYDRLDRYERILGKVLLGNQDMNLEQIKAGLAMHAMKHLNYQSKVDREKYAAAELDARRNKRGFWADRVPAAPRGRPMEQAEEAEDSTPVMDESRMKSGH